MSRLVLKWERFWAQPEWGATPHHCTPPSGGLSILTTAEGCPRCEGEYLEKVTAGGTWCCPKHMTSTTPKRTGTSMAILARNSKDIDLYFINHLARGEDMSWNTTSSGKSTRRSFYRTAQLLQQERDEDGGSDEREHQHTQSAKLRGSPQGVFDHRLQPVLPVVPPAVALTKASLECFPTHPEARKCHNQCFDAVLPHREEDKSILPVVSASV